MKLLKKRVNPFIFLITSIILIILIYPILIIQVFVHENGHIEAAKKQNITFILKEIKLDLSVYNLKEWGNAESQPLTQEDCLKFNSLSNENKKKITHAGVIAEIEFLSLLLILPFMGLIFCLHKKKNFVWIYFFMLLIISLLVMMGASFFSNVFSSNPKVDWNLLNLSNCSMFN